MKRFYLIILFSIFATSFADVDQQRINRYSGTNAEKLISYIDTVSTIHKQYAEFILNNSSSADLAILTPEYIEKNIHYAIKARELPYTKDYDETIFRHFVLPHRMSQEPLENWREVYYQELMPLVENTQSIAEAAIIVNIWCLEQMTYKPTHGRDQSAFTSAKRGYGRCEEMMIIYMCAARAVGIPVRSCSAPYWNFTDSNHAWIEVWTPSGWKYLGEPANSLSKTWFTNTTQRATLITAKAFGNYDHPNVIKQVDNVTTLSSIEYYTESYQCRIKILDEQSQPVQDAVVTPMAVSFGGIWGLTELTTGENGICELPLGKGSTLIMAGKNDKCGWFMLNNLDGNNQDVEIVIKEDQIIDEDFEFLFPIPGSNPHENEEPEYFSEKFDLMRENADLKRKDRLNNQKFTAEFARIYDQVNLRAEPDDEYFADRKSFLEKTDQLAANADDFLHVLNQQDDNGKWIIASMLESWDIKDLIEIPDSLALDNLVDIYRESRNRYDVGDSLFCEFCIKQTWQSASPPQNNWQNSYFEKIDDLLTPDIESSVANIISWIDKSTEIDKDFTYTYYSTGLNPLQILNLYYIPEFYRTKLINSALKLSGIPTRWEGQLQFYNGTDWQPVKTNSDENEIDSIVKNFSLSVFIDGVEVKAEPYDNFLVAALGKDGELYHTWFDGENDSLMFKGKYRIEPEEKIYLEAVVRNSNGDAQVAIRPLVDDEQHIMIDLITPKEYLDYSNNWDRYTLESLKSIVKSENDLRNKVLLVLGKQSSEPQIHTLISLADKAGKISDLETDLFIYSEGQSLDELKENPELEMAKFIEGSSLLNDELEIQDYPALFIWNQDDELVFSTTGYNMGIADLIIKKLK